ncbi:hypothetical protein BD413DRAFT_610789 [Trametes elegans]|nr:hypothetical protein BD413DRAFT_610789 [Trametes elegans]
MALSVVVASVASDGIGSDGQGGRGDPGCMTHNGSCRFPAATRHRLLRADLKAGVVSSPDQPSSAGSPSSTLVTVTSTIPGPGPSSRAEPSATDEPPTDRALLTGGIFLFGIGMLAFAGAVAWVLLRRPIRRPPPRKGCPVHGWREHQPGPAAHAGLGSVGERDHYCDSRGS